MAPRSLVDLGDEPLRLIVTKLAILDVLHLPTHMIEETAALAATCSVLRAAVAQVRASEWPRQASKTRHQTKITDAQLTSANKAQLQRWAKLLGAQEWGTEAQLRERLAPLRPPARSPIAPWLWAANYNDRRSLMRARDAKAGYRMTDVDLGLLHDYRNGSNSMHQYRKHEVVAAARARFQGDLAWFQDHSRAAPPHSDNDKQAARRQHVAEALKQAGIDQGRYMDRFRAFIDHNHGKISHIIHHTIMPEVYAERLALIKAAVAAAGLLEEYGRVTIYDYQSVFSSYYRNGGTEADLLNAIDCQCARENRMWEVRELLEAAGQSTDTARGKTTNAILMSSPFRSYIFGDTSKPLQVLLEQHQAKLGRLGAIKIAAAAAGLPAKYTQPGNGAFESTFGRFYQDGCGQEPEVSAKAVQVRLQEVAAGEQAAQAAARASADAARMRHLPLRD